MKRDKVISLRVDSCLYKKFISIVESKTEKFVVRGNRNFYRYVDDRGNTHDKFTAADLFEQALRQYVSKYESQP